MFKIDEDNFIMITLLHCNAKGQWYVSLLFFGGVTCRVARDMSCHDYYVT